MQNTPVIERAPDRLADERFDLIVIGGGVYGVMIATEAARAGLRPLLLERGDFGSATSHNSLRIVHGGLRYLQSFDLARFRESVRAQEWFLESLPGFVTPLPCLMPLYDEGLHRRSLFRVAVTVNDLLAGRRRSGLLGGRVATVDETRSIFPGVDTRGLRGGGVWYDAFIPNVPRMLIDLLRSVCGMRAHALNYVEALGPIEAEGGVEGVRALDRVSGRELEFRSRVVINAAGPWSRAFTASCGGERRDLFEPSIAWNLLTRRKALSDHALAVRAREADAHTFFLVPWKGALLVGTGHAPWRGAFESPRPTESMLAAHIEELNRAVPRLDLRRIDVLRVFAGLLPAAEPGTAKLATREVIVDHADCGGPNGLFSVSGVKFTMAAEVARRVLRRAFPSGSGSADGEILAGFSECDDYPIFWEPEPGEQAWKAPLQRAISEEAVLHLDDLLLRRSSLGDHPERALRLAPEACRLFPWDAERSIEEQRRLADALGFEAYFEERAPAGGERRAGCAMSYVRKPDDAR